MNPDAAPRFLTSEKIVFSEADARSFSLRCPETGRRVLLKHLSCPYIGAQYLPRFMTRLLHHHVLRHPVAHRLAHMTGAETVTAHFLSPNEFEWQSQNRTTQKSNHGQLIKDHDPLGTTIHIFVRAKAKMREGKGETLLYCGPVDFESWSGEKPITVRWRLRAEVPAPLWEELGVPDTAAKPSRKAPSRSQCRQSVACPLTFR